MKRKKIAVFLLCCCIGLSALPVSAQELRLGVFDVQKVMRESKTISGYRQEAMKIIEQKRKPIQDKEEYIKALEGKIKKDAKTLTPADKKAIEEKLAREMIEIRRMKEDFDAEALKMDRELTQKTFGEIDSVIKKITEREDYTIIFEKTAAGIVHFKGTVDITGKIIEQLK